MDADTQTVLDKDHPLMIAWNEFKSTDRFEQSLEWAIKTEYFDGRPITDESRKQHAIGAMWTAFVHGRTSTYTKE